MIFIISIDFKSGRIAYNEFHVDFAKPFSEQLDCLTEDLLQIEYDGNYMLDVGWYPEYEANGSFIVQLIKSKNWDDFEYKKCCRTQLELEKSIQDAIVLIEKQS